MTPTPIARTLCLTIGLILLAQPGLTARQVRPALTDLAAKAAHVAVVRCTAARTIQPRSGGPVYTVYTLTPQAQVKGAALTGAVRVRVAGGDIGHLRVTAHGAPAFRTGAAYAVFLRPARHGEGLVVAGAAAGVLPARLEGDTWRIRVGGAEAAKSVGEPAAEIDLEAFRRLLAAPPAGVRS